MMQNRTERENSLSVTGLLICVETLLFFKKLVTEYYSPCHTNVMPPVKNKSLLILIVQKISAPCILVKEQGLNNFEVRDTQYAVGLTPDLDRGDQGDCPWACCNIQLGYTFYSMEGYRSKVTTKWAYPKTYIICDNLSFILNGLDIIHEYYHH